MSLNWKYEKFRRLYTREEGAFAQLPMVARGIASLLLKVCDDRGRIALCGRSAVDALAFTLGCDRNDKNALRRHVPQLISEGYLVLDLERDEIVIRNFVPAQNGYERRSDEAPEASPTDNERATNEQRTNNERTTNEQRTDNERTTDTKISARNLVTHARASSLPTYLPTQREKGESGDSQSFSLVPDDPKPDPVGDFARAGIAELNNLAGRKFSPTEKGHLANCKNLVREKHTPADAVAVVRAKHAEWCRDERMRKQLKPSVLFRPSNFRKYLAEDVPQHGSVVAGGHRATPEEVAEAERQRAEAPFTSPWGDDMQPMIDAARAARKAAEQ